MTPTCIIYGCDRPMMPRGIICIHHRRRFRRTGLFRRMTREDYFFRHVTEDGNGCWIYTPVNPVTGYAQFNTVGENRPTELAHRWSYEHFIAPIPEGLEIDHLCGNRACVNPWHLEPVTHRVNALRGVGSRETCVNGHLYDEENTHIRSNGHRQCRTCRAKTERRFLAAQIA